MYANYFTKKIERSETTLRNSAVRYSKFYGSLFKPDSAIDMIFREKRGSMQKVVWGAPSFWIERFPLYWGIDQGFFAKQSIDLDIWYAYGGPELARALRKGQIHIGEMGEEEAKETLEEMHLGFLCKEIRE